MEVSPAVLRACIGNPPYWFEAMELCEFVPKFGIQWKSLNHRLRVGIYFCSTLTIWPSPAIVGMDQFSQELGLIHGCRICVNNLSQL